METLIKEPKKIEAPQDKPMVARSSQSNVGGLERIFRLLIGLWALIAAILTTSVTAFVLLAVVAFAGILTSAISYCPINAAIGRNTYHEARGSKKPPDLTGTGGS